MRHHTKLATAPKNATNTKEQMLQTVQIWYIKLGMIDF